MLLGKGFKGERDGNPSLYVWIQDFKVFWKNPNDLVIIVIEFEPSANGAPIATEKPTP